ncbi:hypothetical protein [Sphingomonas sp. PAMC 26605]|nr:hypothetical protein [Sphingomonas sp. PAMC 26605]
MTAMDFATPVTVLMDIDVPSQPDFLASVAAALTIGAALYVFI